MRKMQQFVKIKNTLEQGSILDPGSIFAVDRYKLNKYDLDLQ